jgi:hypothetical protein
MSATRLTLAMLLIITIAGAGFILLTDKTTPPTETSTTTDVTAREVSTSSTSTSEAGRSTTTNSTSTLTSTPQSDQQSNQYARVSPDKATYIEVIEGCGHNYGGECLNVRSGPSISNSVVTQLRDNIVLKVADTEENEGRIWYRTEFDEWLRYPNRVSGEWWIAGDFVRPLQATATSTENPNKIETDKRIEVDLSEQKLYAYDGDELFMEEAVSTGKPLYPTPRGNFRVFKMTPSRYMQGPIEGITEQHYDLPGVPWGLYFTYQGAVIHGSYWHDNFGQVWSNGCVNLPPAEAEKLYRWAELGTKVIVRD